MDECTLTVSITSQEQHMLLDLVRTGLYGHTMADAAERLIARQLENKLQEAMLLDAAEDLRGAG